MSETSAIVGIFGAVDEVVQGDREARERVAELLPEYRDPELHWYGDFKQWVADENGVPVAELAFPDAKAAVHELAGSNPGDNPAHARRLFAIEVGIAAQVPALVDPEEMRHVEEALKPLPGPDTGRESTGRRLYNLLAGHGLARPRAAIDGRADVGPWNEKMRQAQAEGLLPDEKGFLPRPCLYELVEASGGRGPVPALITDFTTDAIGYEDLTFDQAIRFIEPEIWAKCKPDFWCEMRLIEQDGPARRRYREVVSSNCGQKRAFDFTVSTDLLFDFIFLPASENAVAALCNYQLDAPRPGQDPLVAVDEGSLLVAKLNGDAQSPLRVVTTKRLQFANRFLAKQVAMIACAFGYTEMTANLLYCAATKGKAVLRNENARFPGAAVTALAANAGRRDRSGRARPRSRGGGARAGGLLRELAAIYGRVLREGASAIERNAPP